MESPDCGARAVDDDRPNRQPVAFHEDPNGWEGVRVFEMSDDPSDPSAIEQVAAQYTDCGAHTITAWPGYAHDQEPRADRVRAVVPAAPGSDLRSGPAQLRPTVQNTDNPYDDDHGRQRPAARRDPGARGAAGQPGGHRGARPSCRSATRATLTGAGLAEKGLHAALEPAAVACHDIVTHMEHNIAGGACAEQGQVWEIDPEHRDPGHHEPDVDR